MAKGKVKKNQARGTKRKPWLNPNFPTSVGTKKKSNEIGATDGLFRNSSWAWLRLIVTRLRLLDKRVYVKEITPRNGMSRRSLAYLIHKILQGTLFLERFHGQSLEPRPTRRFSRSLQRHVGKIVSISFGWMM